MNPPLQPRAPSAPPRGAAMKPALVRRRRAAIARRLHSGAPAISARIDWAALDAAPGWLGMSDPELARFAMRVGALTCAPTLRMWIDASRLSAANAAIGTRFLQSLLTLPEAQVPLPRDLTDGPAIGTADRVVPVLRASGLAVLVASLPTGPLREAAASLWEPVKPSEMADELARILIARVQSLAASAEPAPASEAKASRAEHGEPA